MDEDGKYIDLFTSNPDLLVLPKEQIINKTIFDVFDNDLANYFLKSIKSSISENRVIIISYDAETPSGRRSFEASITPVKLKHSSGKKLLLLLLATLATENKLSWT